jgi:hypothetical protein
MAIVGSVLRYTASRCALSQVWVPPWLVYLLIVAIAYPPNTPALGSLSLGAIVLLPISAWLCLATLNSESEQQSASMAALAGGVVTYRMLVLVSALCAALALVPFSILYALLHNAGPLPVGDVVAAVLAHGVSAAVGTTIGALVARPLIARVGFALVWSCLLVVALIAIPHLPPVRLMVELLKSAHLHTGDVIVSGATTAATLVGAAIVCWGSAVFSRRRT